MRSLLYLIAVILIIGWIFGFFVYSVGGLIHILLILAVISILVSLIRGWGQPFQTRRKYATHKNAG
jgi:hypothetical protein